MRKRYILVAIVIICYTITLLTGCGRSIRDNDIAKEQDGMVAYDFEPMTFYSFDGFVDSIVHVNVNLEDMYNLSGINYYYIPSGLFTGITLDAITVKERYVCLYYYYEDLCNTDFPSADDEEIARIANTLKLEWVRNAVGEELLSNTIEQLSLKELSNGIYYFDITYPTQANIVLAKSLFWVQDGYMFNLDIPQSVFESFFSRSDFPYGLTEIQRIMISK